MEALGIWLTTNPWLGFGGLFIVALFILSLRGMVQAQKDIEKAKASGIKLHPHIHSPVKNGHKTLFDRISPLLYEETKSGKWKLSLGRVAFWSTQITFIGMCVAVMVSLKDQHDVDGNLVTLYISVITMIFLTNLGLLAYNLGSKFTTPMTQFITTWGSTGNTSNVLGRMTVTHDGQPPTETSPPPSEARPATSASIEEGPPEGFTPGGGDDH